MRRLLPGLICTIVILVGCTAQSTTDQTQDINELKKQIEENSLEKEALLSTIKNQKEELELAKNEQVTSDSTTLLAKNIEKYPQTLYKSSTFDIDGDGEDEIIELYVNVEKMENGSLAWDDGQDWLLVVKDGGITYPLFDDYIQLGSLDFSTTTFDGEPGIVMLMTQHANITIQKLTYDKKEKGYEIETFYHKENMQDHYNQPASYGFFKDAYELMEIAFTAKTLAVLEASENSLQDRQERMAIIEPILVDVENAQQKLKVVVELNRELKISLDSTIDLLNEMVNNSPTADQMNQLRSIHSVFTEIGNGELIIEGVNQIHPDVKEKFQRIGFIKF
ncbi:hypothetical protein [Sporosarcina sp. BP05]|uniref:hypothetical protein n=1 Tax=Sporosarcina sp. BP05 TaxID=2758726 RepID=UPI0016457A91|nr:hypothetical protein [Sporosarcina sp. BP05]